MADAFTDNLADSLRIASSLHGLRRRVMLPANYAAYPLGAGQIYGQVATNCRLLNSRAASNKGLMARSHHRAVGAITEIAMVLPNWYVDRANGKFELPNDGDIQFTATIEYPAGVFNRLRFTGANREACQGGTVLVSDFLGLAIPDNAEFWTNVWMQATTSIVFYSASTGQVSANGEKATVNTVSVTDYTGGGGANTAQVYGFWPLALLGRTANKAAAIVGDSIAEGLNDTADATDAVGSVARSISGASYINLSQSGDRLELALLSSARRLAVLPFTRNAICAMGVNDIGSARTLAAIKLDMVARWTEAKAMLSGAQRVFQTTITPSVTSSDSYATTANQTAAANFSTGGAGTRELLNDWLRDGAPLINGAPAAIGATTGSIRAGNADHPLYQVIEFADVVESARNSGKWKVDGTANKWTSDGLHPSPYAYGQIAASGALTAAMLG
jgi:lysophospholipase L1-like esterase